MTMTPIVYLMTMPSYGYESTNFTTYCKIIRTSKKPVNFLDAHYLGRSIVEYSRTTV